MLLTQEGCNPCRRVKRILGEILKEVPSLNVREVSFDSDEGMKLAMQHNILFPPAIFIDGRMMAKGKVREEDLRRELGASPPRGGIP